MINFTTINSTVFWENNILELSHFFKDKEQEEHWTNHEDNILPFLIFFEIQLNNLNNLSTIISKESHFNSFIEILAYLKLGTFFYLIYEINKEQSSFIISCLLNCKQENNIYEKLFLNCKQENNIYEKLFIERFQLLNQHYLLSYIFNDNKTKLIKTIIENSKNKS